MAGDFLFQYSYSALFSNERNIISTIVFTQMLPFYSFTYSFSISFPFVLLLKYVKRIKEEEKKRAHDVMLLRRREKE
jgi:hypothetical protein